MDARALILAHTVVARPILCPELRLHLITEDCPLWRAREPELEALGLPEPYWAFAWPGGQALARWILDHPEVVRGRRVLDFGAGGGLDGIAAALSGARVVRAAELDPVAVEAITLNAALNGVSIEAACEDPVGRDVAADVVLAGDVLYDAAQAGPIVAWLGGLAAAGALVIAGDPDRGHVPAGVEVLATYDAPADVDVGGRHTRRTRVVRLRG